jgi:hypothetical protein
MTHAVIAQPAAKSIIDIATDRLPNGCGPSQQVVSVTFVIGRDLSETATGEIRVNMNRHGTTMHAPAVGGTISASLATT